MGISLGQKFGGDVELDVALGLVAGRSSVHKFGRATVGNSSFDTIWYAGGAYNWLQAADSVRVKAGGNANDTAGGSGARSIMIIGLNQDWEEVSEVLNLAGASASAPSAATFIRVVRAYVIDVGAYGGTSAADIEIETVGGTTIALLESGLDQTQLGLYSVPAGKTAFLRNIRVSVAANKPVDLRLMRRLNADLVSAPFGATRILGSFDEVQGGDGYYFSSPQSFPEKTDIWVEGKATTGTAAVVARMDFTVVENA